MAVNTRLSRSLAILQPVAHSSEFEPALRDIAAIYGLKHVTCLVVRAGGGTDKYPLFFTTYPRSWTDIYLSRSYFEIDPVIDIIRWARLPVDWSRLHGTSPAISLLQRGAPARRGAEWDDCAGQRAEWRTVAVFGFLRSLGR